MFQHANCGAEKVFQARVLQLVWSANGLGMRLCLRGAELRSNNLEAPAPTDASLRRYAREMKSAVGNVTATVDAGE
jgi:hypothetical protein